MLTPRFTETNHQCYIQKTMEKCAEYIILVRFEHCSDKGLELYQSDSNAMPTESLVKKVKRNEDDSRGEINHQKEDQIREEVRHIRLKDDPNAAPWMTIRRGLLDFFMIC